MSRYLLDTNVLVFILSGEDDNISQDVSVLLKDYNNQLFVSSISVIELLQLYRSKKIKPKFKTAKELKQAIENNFYIKILPFSKEHLKILSNLRIKQNHNDPFDHSIIAHAITEKIILISSDRQFDHYTKQKLDFVFNKRG